MAAQRGAAARWNASIKRPGAAAASSSCEPPSDQPQAACLPPQQERYRSGGAASAGCVLLPPCMRHRRSACATLPPLSMRKGSPRTECSALCRAACCPFGDAPCVCFNGRENRSRGRPVSAAHAASPGVSLRSRSSECASNGQRVEEAWLRGLERPMDGHEFASMSTVYGIREEGAIVGDRN